MEGYTINHIPVITNTTIRNKAQRKNKSYTLTQSYSIQPQTDTHNESGNVSSIEISTRCVNRLAFEMSKN